MQIIPVIDLKDNHVVHARQGSRAQYQPLNTPLCPSSRLFDVIEAFLAIQRFECFYIADLNAITGSGNHEILIADMLSKYTDIDFWIDRGLQANFFTSPYAANHIPILGSESLNEQQLLKIPTLSRPFILSLDFSAETMLGPDQLFGNQQYWPDNIILMQLHKVGSNLGPDYPLLEKYRQRFVEKNFIAAGGVRNFADLLQLKSLGIEQVLIATALHTKEIGSKEIIALADVTK
jgi:phosphoribosylformimino-5-aminoimidazole carboxamide ribotide isomerase